MRISCILAGLLLAACFGRGRTEHHALGGADVDLEQARADFRHGEFSRALLEFRRVQFELTPSQPEMAEVRYFVAECDFQLGDHSTAALEFRKMADEYPSSEFAPLALLRSGDANVRQWRRVELDPTPGQTALATYQELQGRFPGTDAAARAQLSIRQLNNWFADKAYRNGMFYLRRHAYDSAIIYFKDVIASYPDSRHVAEALLRLVDSYKAIGYAAEFREACDHLRHYYPTTSGLNQRCPAGAATDTIADTR
jgi:outer membrane protein assembly factor BamD